MSNRLAASLSLYLRKHAENPIDWWPWIPEAHAMARQTDRPIFLSIGYSSCHWCTVMEGEAFSDPEIADYMNAHYLPIKVDREERPDIDSIYMQSLQLMTGQGGWPLNVFLTPDDLVPFYAGTYFPLEPRYGRPGFLQVLQKIRQFYDQQKEQIANHKVQLVGSLSAQTQLIPEATLEPNLLAKGIRAVMPILNSMTNRQQFPMMPYAQLVLRASRYTKQQIVQDGLSVKGEEALLLARQRGVDLALGGIFDHVAGGFHRYTTDPTWTVPHFEKMLYDNGQIVEFLSDLWASGIRDEAIERAISLTVEWLQREMTAPEGYFYAAQDADSFATAEDIEPEEGDFYVWRWSELQQALTEEEFDLLQKEFDLSEAGNFPERPGYLVLQRLTRNQLRPGLDSVLREKLFALRYGSANLSTFPPARSNAEAKMTQWPGRIPPVTDTKMIVAWNSLMISGLARAYQVFRIPSYRQVAVRAAQFILQSQQPNGSLCRLNYDGMATIAAKSEDYALLIKALIDLHQASLDPNSDPPDPFWLEQAIVLQDQMNERLWDPEMGGYFVSDAENSAELLIREKEIQEGATPAANGVALSNLVRLAAVTGNLTYLDRAEKGLKTFAHFIETQPRACPSLITALDWYQNFLKVAATSDPIQTLQSQYWPTTMLVNNDPQDPLPTDAIGLVCVGTKCLDPAMTFEQLQAQMLKGQVRC